MPELIEVEAYRALAVRTVHRTIESVPVLDELGLRGADPDAIRAELVGLQVTGVGRIGKLLLLETDGPTIGLRFGMTGRLLVDGEAVIDRLEYGVTGDDPVWDRTVFRFVGGGDLRVHDPRRLGGLELDPDRSRLGPDAADLTVAQLRGALGSSSVAVKARLLDQSRVAGLGNLLVDEVLWRAGIDPARRCDDLDPASVRLLARTIVATVRQLAARGGSHRGDLQAERSRAGHCPRDGATLERLTVGGRTTYRCPAHQH